jgi:hypothetical protein
MLNDKIAKKKKGWELNCKKSKHFNIHCDNKILSYQNIL